MVIINFDALKHNFTGIAYDSYGKSFRKNSVIHRYYGPAILNKNNQSKSWWFEGDYYNSYYKEYYLSNSNFLFKFLNKMIKPKIIYDYNQKQFFKDLNKQWLS